jgi:hypothetical protein
MMRPLANWRGRLRPRARTRSRWPAGVRGCFGLLYRVPATGGRCRAAHSSTIEQLGRFGPARAGAGGERARGWNGLSRTQARTSFTIALAGLLTGGAARSSSLLATRRKELPDYRPSFLRHLILELRLAGGRAWTPARLKKLNRRGGAFKVDYALSGPLPWRVPAPLARSTYIWAAPGVWRPPIS